LQQIPAPGGQSAAVAPGWTLGAGVPELGVQDPKASEVLLVSAGTQRCSGNPSATHPA